MEQGRVAREQAAHAVDLGDLDGFLAGHGRQDRGHGASHQGLARARTPRHEDVMPAGCRHFQRAPHMLLAADLAEVHRVIAVVGPVKRN